MATISPTVGTDIDSRDHAEASILAEIVDAFASLKLTVALFAFSLVIVLVGTLAQDEMNMPEVKARYFTSWIAWLHFDDLFPDAFFPKETPAPGEDVKRVTFLGLERIPFPGGALIGFLLLLNLVAAKATRFKIHVKGGRLAAGIGVLVAGAAVAALIIFTGYNSEGIQGLPPISYDALWKCILGLLAAGSFAAVMYSLSAEHRVLKISLLSLAALAGAMVVFSLLTGYRIGDPGLRIVWQLGKGIGAALIMLVGCSILFGKQGGNVLLHIGVALLMFGQFTFGDRQTEQKFHLIEGESTNTLINMEAPELAFIRTADDEQVVTVVPASRLLPLAGSDTILKNDALPVDVRVVEYFENSTLIDPNNENPATAGIGTANQAQERRKHGGTGSQLNVPAAYVELLNKETGESLGTYLVSTLISEGKMLLRSKDSFDTITVGDEKYEIGLRFSREVKPYWVQLEDVRQVTYSGTETPRDYRSFIRIVNPETGDDRRERVWMNNPLRYRGESFFQSDYSRLPSGKETTGIQVVRNSGWLIPYVACGITGVGMLAHFMVTLMRFIRRREREVAKESITREQQPLLPVYASVAAVAFLAMMMLVPWSAVMNSMRTSTRAASFDLYAVGKIPTQFGGRVLPLDAYARQALKAMTNKESLPLPEKPDEGDLSDKKKASVAKAQQELYQKVQPIINRATKQKGSEATKLSAIQWLMEAAINEPALVHLPMFRIDAVEVLNELELERRESKLYSLAETEKNWDRAIKQLQVAARKETADLTFKEKKLFELHRRRMQFLSTSDAMKLPEPLNIPDELLERMLPGSTEQERQRFKVQALKRHLEELSDVPAIIPPTEEAVAGAVSDPDWSAFGYAFFKMAEADATGQQANVPPGVEEFGEVIAAYADEDTMAFNTAVDKHLAAVKSYPIAGYQPERVAVERWMQSNSPTLCARVLYLIALVLGLVHLASGQPRLRKAVWGMLLVAFVVHTVAIACRVGITGRAPVINIYSSAVFIGWAVVLFGLVLEPIFRYGVGNVLAAIGGALTLQVAWGLNKGDTMPVLQAVLDTQFWLATHVICVSLGYVATLVAGTLGIGYLLSNWLGKDATFQRNVYRACYGAACFGVLFSFIGTVLGGLWADDSWGRFWGWDPKENGALLIVIWNALMLHARWDGMVAARGFSVLAIGGNIITAWSWFGTNELGIGLHSYGFTEGTMLWLTTFFLSQMLLIVAGMAFIRKPPATIES